jgi:S1-C subfamily serine protease
VGGLVVAAGIPFGLIHTVTMGIVDYEAFIQTDGMINPGVGPKGGRNDDPSRFFMFQKV